MEYKLFLDTNALLNLGLQAFKEPFIISQQTLMEIESIKVSGNKDGEIKYKARQVSRLLDENYGKYFVVLTDEDVLELITDKGLSVTPDNIISAAAKLWEYTQSKVLFCSDDLNCKVIAREIFGLPIRSTKEINLITDADEYTGYRDVTFTDDEMSHFYTNLNDNFLGLVKNEYLIIRKSNGEVVDYRKWDGTEYHALSYKQINNMFIGKVKPKNPQQVLAFDMLQDKNTTIKVLSGRFGSGKDFLMISNALKLVEEGKFDKIIYVRNPIGVKDVKDIGYLPGTKDEKLKQYAMVLADHLGGENGLDIQLTAGYIEIEHLGYIRGRDIKNSIIYCTEAENLTKEHVQLLIGRVGEGSALWMNGDFKQTDSPLFRMNNGLLSAVSKLAGHEKFGYVQLQKTERSETAAMADLLD